MTPSNNRAFTLIELLIAMAISGIVMTAIYATYQSQQKSYLVQEEVAAIQQNLRATMYFMTQQIREAGCDPSGNLNAGIVTANFNKIQFTEDVRDNDDTDADGIIPNGNTNDRYEDITYSLETSGNTNNLHLETVFVQGQPKGGKTVSENIDALDFVYLDQSGNVLNDDGNGNVTTNINKIRSVEVTLVVRAGREDLDYVNNTAFKNQRENVILPAQNDHYRRMRSTVRIKCRNL
jgi:type IV pilus assembly protein PilW